METGKFSTSGYTADGRKVFFELPATATTNDMQALILAARWFGEALTAAGITVRETGIEAGENVEEVAYLVVRQQKNDDGRPPTPVLDLYPEQLKHRFLNVYLNTADDVTAFENATGLQLARLPVHKMKAPITRGDPDVDNDYVVRLPRPVRIVWKPNPHYEEGGTKPKRHFERWLDVVSHDDKGESGSVANNPILGANSGNPEMLHDLIVTAVSVAKPGNYRLTAWTADEKEIQVFTWGHDLFRSWGLPKDKWEAWDNAGGGTVKFPANVTYVTSAQWQRAKDAKTENDGYWLAVIPVAEAF